MLSHEDQIVAAIRQIVRAVDVHSRRLVEAHGLTGPQLAVLKELERRGPTPPTMLARAVHLSQATLSGVLQRLERQSLVRRDPSSADRRSVIITISAEGSLLLKASPSLLHDQFRQALSSLEEWERLQILSTLQRVALLMGLNSLEPSSSQPTSADAAKTGIQRSSDGDVDLRLEETVKSLVSAQGHLARRSPENCQRVSGEKKLR